MRQSVTIGSVTMGPGHPVVIQSMTDTNTEDIDKTVQQIQELSQAGSQLVRLTVNTPKAAEAIPIIKKILTERKCFTPLIGDFHYNGHRLLTDYPLCAQILDKYRINPGNVGFGDKHDPQFATIIAQAIKYNKAVRIGVNWGSLDQKIVDQLMNENATLSTPLSSDDIIEQALYISAVKSAEKALKLGLSQNKLVISCKVSRVPHLIRLYQKLSSTTPYVLHLGLTEAGIGPKGIIASTAALAPLLLNQIGDTIRVSLTPAPHTPRTQEVEICQTILQTLELRYFSPIISSCPGCGRTSSTYFRELAQDIEDYIAKKKIIWQKNYINTESLKIAVMGCIVNGPGESKHADIGISLPGNGEQPIAPVFINGEKKYTLKGAHITQDFITIIENYIATHYQKK